jgi:hypothetical protein
VSVESAAADLKCYFTERKAKFRWINLGFEIGIGRKVRKY